MEKLTRRSLFKQASVSAGMVGLAGVTAACAGTPTSTAGATGTAQAAATGAVATAQSAATAASQITIPTEPIAVFVTNPAQGNLLLVRGDSEITVQSKDIVQAILALK